MAQHRLLRSVRAGVETVATGDQDRHHHREAYATIVLAGRFEEAAFAGRSNVQPGEVLLHAAFDAHANVGGGGRGPTILRLPWYAAGAEGRYRVRDPDALARLAERCPFEARALLAEMLEPVAAARGDWADRLAADLTDDSVESLAAWGERNRLAPSALSRGFREAYGCAPKLFRLEVRTRRAWRSVMRSGHSLTGIAHHEGFADLAHMSRSIAQLTGQSPSGWRRAAIADKCVQAALP